MNKKFEQIEKITNKILQGDTLQWLKKIPSDSIDLIITSPPYYLLRNYEVKGQIGLEKTFKEYLDKIIEIMKEVKRVLKPTGTCWINFGDSYEKTKCLLMQPERFAIRCCDELGLVLRNRIVWAKSVLIFDKKKGKYTIGSAMPTSVKSRFNESYEFLYFFTKNNKTILWRNKNTREWVNKKPLGIHGVENKDWEWKECYNKKPDCKKCGGTGIKKVSLWEGYSYWCDLDAVRLPHSEATWQRLNYSFNPTKSDIQGAVKYTGLRSFQKRMLEGNYCVQNVQLKAGQPFTSISKYAKGSEFEQKYGEPWDKFGKNTKKAKNQRKSLEERMADTKNKDTKSSRSYNIKRLLSEVRLGIKPNTGMISNTFLLGKNIPTVFQINPEPHSFSRELNIETEHFAVFAEKLVETPILFGAPPNGIVLDFFAGSFTSCLVAEKLGRKWIGIELNPNYCKLGQKRIEKWRKENKANLFNKPEDIEQPSIIKLDS